MRLLIIMLLFSVSVSSQTFNNLRIQIGDEVVNYDMTKCYKKPQTITTPKGVKLKIVVWPSYAPWGEEKSLIIRSLPDGKYSTNMQFGSMDLGLSINLNKEK